MEEKFLEAKMLDITKNTGTNMLDIYFFLSTLNIKEMEFESQSLKRKFFTIYLHLITTIMLQSKMVECDKQIDSLLSSSVFCHHS